MYIYILIASLLFLGYFANSKKYLSTMYIILFVFTALRNPYVMGTDGRSYLAFFNNIVPTLSNFKAYNHAYEIGYALLNSFVKTFSNEYFVFQLIYCVLATLLLVLVIKKTNLTYSEKCLLLFVYFCFRYFQNSMEFLRQNIAILFVWYAFLVFRESRDSNINKTKCFGAIGLGWLFHRSALFNYISVLLISFLKKKRIAFILAITAVASIILLSIGTPAINSIINAAILFGGERYKDYFIDGEVAYGLNWINYLLRWFFILLLALGLKLRFSNATEAEYLEFKKEKYFLILGCVAIMCGSINVGIFTRMLEYFMIGIYLSIVKSIYTFKGGAGRNIYLVGIYLAFIIILARNLHTISAGTYMNYELYPFR